MAKGDCIGVATCPCCDKPAEVNEDKTGKPLLFCRHGCRLQLFTRNEAQAAGLLRKVRPVTPATPDNTPPATPPTTSGLSKMLSDMGIG